MARAAFGALIAVGLLVAGGSVVGSVVLSQFSGGVTCEGVTPHGLGTDELSLIPFGPSCPVDGWAADGIDPSAGGPHLAWTLMLVVGSLAVLAGAAGLIAVHSISSGPTRPESVWSWLVVGSEVGAVSVGLLSVAMSSFAVSTVGMAASEGGGPTASTAVAAAIAATILGSSIGALFGAVAGALGNLVWTGVQTSRRGTLAG